MLLDFHTHYKANEKHICNLPLYCQFQDYNTLDLSLAEFLFIATLAAVAPYIATITQFVGIHFADEFTMPSSVILTSVS